MGGRVPTTLHTTIRGGASWHVVCTQRSQGYQDLYPKPNRARSNLRRDHGRKARWRNKLPLRLGIILKGADHFWEIAGKASKGNYMDLGGDRSISLRARAHRFSHLEYLHGRVQGAGLLVWGIALESHVLSSIDAPVIHHLPSEESLQQVQADGCVFQPESLR